MRIITISREFGSGGRELGKRLSDALSFDYYDREIITAIAQNCGLNEDYVAGALENHGWTSVPLTYGHSFSALTVSSPHTELLIEQTKVLRGIAETGKDCIIVGRSADVLLEEFNPFRIFVCADMPAKIARCRERAPEDEKLTDKELEQKMRRIDKNRADTRNMIADTRWGDAKSYNLVVNTTGWDMKTLTACVAGTVTAWFEQQ